MLFDINKSTDALLYHKSFKLTSIKIRHKSFSSLLFVFNFVVFNNDIVEVYIPFIYVTFILSFIVIYYIRSEIPVERFMVPKEIGGSFSFLSELKETCDFKLNQIRLENYYKQTCKSVS